MTDSYLFSSILIMALVTALLRFAPFIIFSGKNRTPSAILYLGKVLPYAIMGMLIVYCLRNIEISASPYGLPECLAVSLVVVLHRWKKNTLLSIVSGTAFYMFLVQQVF